MSVEVDQSQGSRRDLTQLLGILLICSVPVPIWLIHDQMRRGRRDLLVFVHCLLSFASCWPVTLLLFVGTALEAEIIINVSL